ncbi:MAG TPA: tetratricopeptide repeat protein [Kiritimatiellia bacterium]|nr:tetratricopeptide repeat protein [Kiritimatiellia bacterium]
MLRDNAGARRHLEKAAYDEVARRKSPEAVAEAFDRLHILLLSEGASASIRARVLDDCRRRLPACAALPRMYEREGDALLAANRPRPSLDCYAAAGAGLSPGGTNAVRLLRGCLAADNPGQGIAAMQEWLDRYPDSPLRERAESCHAVLLARHGNLAEAVSCLEAFLKEHPGSRYAPEVDRALANARTAAKRLEQIHAAQAAKEEERRRAPALAEIEQAEALLAKNRFDAAAKGFMAFNNRRGHPLWGRAWFGLGKARRALGDTGGALAAWDDLWRRSLTDTNVLRAAEARRAAGDAWLEDLGDPARALKAYGEAAARASFTDSAFDLNRGLALLMLGRAPEAEAVFARRRDASGGDKAEFLRWGHLVKECAAGRLVPPPRGLLPAERRARADLALAPATEFVVRLLGEEDNVTGEKAADTIHGRVVSVDLDVDADYNGVINDLDEPLEENPGGYACGRTNSLTPVKLTLEPANLPGKLTLSANVGDTRIKVWQDMGRATQVTLPKTWNAGAQPGTVYVEGISPSAALRDVELRLEYDENPQGQDNPLFKCADAVRLTILKVDTETVATVPADRTRKKVGVGEQVTLTLQPTSLTPVSWSISGNGTLSATTGNPVTFTAHDRASTPAITATYGGGSCSVNFNVVEPDGVAMEQEPGTGSLAHKRDCIGRIQGKGLHHPTRCFLHKYRDQGTNVYGRRCRVL